MPEIYLPEKIIFGKNKLKDFRPEACDHAILICDSDIFVNRGFLDIIRTKSTKIISQLTVLVNQNINDLYRSATEAHLNNEADLIIAAGSAGAIDCGMLISHESGADFTAIPVCGASGITDFENSGYYSYRHSPNTLILDPAIIECMPSGVVAYDGLASFAYAVDTLMNDDNVITKSLAVHGAVGILNNIIPACRGDIVSLEKLMYAMYFSVAAHRNAENLQSSPLNKISEFFSQFGYSKSAVSALVIPNIMEHEKDILSGSLFEIARATGFAQPDYEPVFANERLTDYVRKIQASLSVPRSASGFGLDENQYRAKRLQADLSEDLLDTCYYGSFKFMKL